MKGLVMARKRAKRRIAFGPRESKVHKEIWGDFYKSTPGISAVIDYLNSGEKGMKTMCPHCGDAALIRSSKQMSKLVKHSTCTCLNPACGHSFIVSVEAIRTLSPPAFPDPEVAKQLKQSDRWPVLQRQTKDSSVQHFAEDKKMT